MGKYIKTNWRAAMVMAAMMMVAPMVAHAACSTPAGVAGDQFFNTTYSRMQYCDGTN